MQEPANPFGETPHPSRPTNEMAKAPAATPVEWYEPPRLGIIHLLAWVTVAAILMKFDQAVSSFESASPLTASEKVVSNVLNALLAIVNAAIFTGGAVFLLDRSRGKRGKFQPGHWIVAISVLPTLGIILSGALEAWLGEANEGRYLAAFMVYFVTEFPATIAWFVAAYRLPQPRRWKWALAFLGLQSFGFSLYFGGVLLISNKFADPFQTASRQRILNNVFDATDYLGIAIAVCVLLIGLLDFWKRRRRDWLHWLGVAIPIAMTLFQIGWTLAEKLVANQSQNVIQ